MKLEINKRRKAGKSTDMWKLNNTLLKNQWVKKEIKRSKTYLETNKMETQHTKLMECSKVIIRRKFVV